jgi:hypothetical protein
MSDQLKIKIIRLERKMMLLCLFCIFNSLICVTLFYISYSKRNFDYIATNSLYIQNKERIVVELGATENGGYLETVTHDGKPLVSLGKTAIGGTLTLYNTNGHSLVELGNTKNGGFIGTYNTAGKKIIELNRTGYGGDISVFDNNTNLSAHLTTVKNGGVVNAYLKNENAQQIMPAANIINQ